MKYLLNIGDYNHKFSNGVGMNAAFVFSSDMYTQVPLRTLNEMPTLSQHKLLELYTSRPISSRLPLSDHLMGKTSFKGINIVTWNANCKLHNKKELSNSKVNQLRILKIRKIRETLDSNTHILTLNEWGNVKFDRGELNKKQTFQDAFAALYGYKALRKDGGISVCTIRQYLGLQSSEDITEGVKNCDYVMYVGEAGKVILFKPSILKLNRNDKYDVMKPIPIRKNKLLSKLKLLNNKHFETNIFTSIVPLNLYTGDTIFVMGVHDTALGAYHGRFYNKDRWLKRNSIIHKWFEEEIL